MDAPGTTIGIAARKRSFGNLADEAARSPKAKRRGSRFRRWCTVEGLALGGACAMLVGLYLLLQPAHGGPDESSSSSASPVVVVANKKKAVPATLVHTTADEPPPEAAPSSGILSPPPRHLRSSSSSGDDGPTPGFATPDGTARFAARHAAEAALYGLAPFDSASSPLTISSIGLGTYLGDADARTDELVERAVAESLGAGVNHVDTASNYRKGRAEAAVGRALRRGFESNAVRRDEVLVATKAGFVSSADLVGRARKYGATDADFDPSGRHCVAPACVRASLDLSLERLQLETVDVLYLHNVCEKRSDLSADAIRDVLATAFRYLESERQRGRIRYYGLATFSKAFRVVDAASDPAALRLTDVVEWAAQAAAPAGTSSGFRFVQLPVGPDAPEAYAERTERGGRTFLRAARDLGIAVVGSKSLGLTRARRRRAAPGATAAAHACPDDAAYRDAIADPGARKLHLARSVPGLTTALVGHKTPDHVAANLALTTLAPLAPAAFADALAHCPQPPVAWS